MFDKIAVIGLGYIGLPTATLFASKKIQVIGVDIAPSVVDTINQGKIHIVEPELDILVHAAVTHGCLRAALHPEPADAFLITVPTPFMDGYKPDLSFIKAAANSIAPFIKKGDLIVLESTSPVGTTEYLASWLADMRSDLSFPQHTGDDADIQIAYCPERVLPGRIMDELITNDRVIGGMTNKASNMAVDLYKSFVEGKCIITDARTAEMCKLTENSYRDVNIAFANELSMICARLGINVWKLIELANRHPRVNILQPGAGVGGHCIAVDPWFIVDTAPEEARLIRTAREVNDHKPCWVIARVRAAIAKVVDMRPGRNATNIRVACLGLAFKPDIDDLRESPAIEITKSIANFGCKVLAVEPHIKKLPARLAQAHNIYLYPLDEAIRSADIICILVKHQVFNGVVPSLYSHPYVLDAVGLLNEKSKNRDLNDMHEITSNQEHSGGVAQLGKCNTQGIQDEYIITMPGLNEQSNVVIPVSLNT